jgi:protein FRG1
VRTNIFKPDLNPEPLEERGTIEEAELAIAKKYQHWQDMRMKISKEDISNVKKAKLAGNLHSELLDRRAGMKSDKYCK